jgi:hypothetical protein
VTQWQQEYRGWRIWRDRSAFYAREPVCRSPAYTLTATSLRRLWAGVDAVERSYTGEPAPIWYLFALAFPDFGQIDPKVNSNYDFAKARSHLIISLD